MSVNTEEVGAMPTESGKVPAVSIQQALKKAQANILRAIDTLG